MLLPMKCEGWRGTPQKEHGYDEVLLRRLGAGYGDALFIANAEMGRPLNRKGHLFDLTDLPARIHRAIHNQKSMSCRKNFFILLRSFFHPILLGKSSRAHSRIHRLKETVFSKRSTFSSVSRLATIPN